MYIGPSLGMDRTRDQTLVSVYRYTAMAAATLLCRFRTGDYSRFRTTAVPSVPSPCKSCRFSLLLFLNACVCSQCHPHWSTNRHRAISVKKRWMRIRLERAWPKYFPICGSHVPRTYIACNLEFILSRPFAGDACEVLRSILTLFFHTVVIR